MLPVHTGVPGGSGRGAVAAAEMHTADQGDTATLPGTLASATEHLAAIEPGMPTLPFKPGSTHEIVLGVYWTTHTPEPVS